MLASQSLAALGTTPATVHLQGTLRASSRGGHAGSPRLAAEVGLALCCPRPVGIPTPQLPGLPALPGLVCGTEGGLGAVSSQTQTQGPALAPRGEPGHAHWLTLKCTDSCSIHDRFFIIIKSWFMIQRRRPSAWSVVAGTGWHWVVQTRAFLKKFI